MLNLVKYRWTYANPAETLEKAKFWKLESGELHWHNPKTNKVEVFNTSHEDAGAGPHEEIKDPKREIKPEISELGQSRNLPEDQVVQRAKKLWDEKGTESPYFKRWFMDSKVVDGKGSPLKVFHGTGGDFDTFTYGGNKPMVYQGKTSSGKPYTLAGPSGRGFWFSPHSDPNRLPAAHNYNPEDQGSKVVSAYLSIQNPLIVDADNMKTVTDTIAEGNSEFPLLITEEAYANLQNAGHDGVFFYAHGRKSHEGPPDEMVALDPRQIKSAADNRGTFDGNKPSMKE